eukprot:m.60288 g.60288  ORF g.60288 m.60288 type:complete len:647 (+) comp11309_c0_seq3:126-2066(+)
MAAVMFMLHVVVVTWSAASAQSQCHMISCMETNKHGNGNVLDVINMTKKSNNTAAAEACCQACQSHAECSAWTLNSGICRVKSGDWVLAKAGGCSTWSGTKAAVPTTTEAPIPTPKPVPYPPNVKNVLMILVDDLRPELGIYGHNTTVTPNIDKLGSEGTVFTRAYVQFAFCAPSRNSFMTGRRPDRTTCFNFVDHFREASIGKTWMSLPEYFKSHEILTLGAGKLFHPMLPPYNDAPASWSYGDASDPNKLNLPYVNPGDTPLEPFVTVPPGLSGCTETEAIIEGDGHWCNYNMTILEQKGLGTQPLWDQVIMNATVHHIHKAKENGRPFFIGCGFHRPHLPFAAPSEFYDAVAPASETKPPKYDRPPTGSPMAAWHPGGFGGDYNNSVPPKQASVFRRAYYAAVSYTDHNVGLVLQALEDTGLSNSTVVIFMGDHGWQLGEMNEWRKMTNWELGVRVPLIVRAPWIATSVGVKSNVIVEAVSIFQTLADLAGLPPPESGVSLPAQNVQGSSFGYVLRGIKPNATQNVYAFSQFPKIVAFFKGYGNQPWDPCTKCNLSTWDYMGYSVRNDRWRYTEWFLWNKTAHLPIWGAFGAGGGAELYDHLFDYGADMDVATDKVNLVEEPQYAQVVANLSKVLKDHFQSDH